jgi:Uma2 family endonuclease
VGAGRAAATRRVRRAGGAGEGDRFTKRRRYQEAGVPLYWIIDGDERQVEVWTPGDVFPRIERDRLVWQPEGANASFTLPLQELFRAIE